MKKKLELLTAAFVFVFIIFSCGDTDSGNKYVDAANCEAVSVSENTYTKAVKTILDNNCASSGCHDAATASEGIDLSTYAKVKSNFVDGKALCAINHDGCEPMPQNSSKLSAVILNQLACWVKEGAPE